MKKNLILDTDAYKIAHPMAIKPGLTKQYTYGEPRVGGKYPYVSFMGLSMIIKDHFLEPITQDDLEEAYHHCVRTFGTAEYLSQNLWQRVINLGYLPMEIKAVPEGTKVPINNVLFTVESTEEWFAPLLNSIETMLMHVWYPTTVATRCMYIRERLTPLVEQSGTLDLIPFMVNDFGARGATDWMADYRGGVGHLAHFNGSDNMPAARAVTYYYEGDRGRSVWATEHSCALAFGPYHGEFEYILHQLDNCQDELICSIVIDTYDAFGFLQNVVGREDIAQKVRDRTGRTVFRPDSGDPVPTIMRCLDILTGIFGYTMNDRGYKVLNDNVGLLQGDGMDEDSIIELYRALVQNHWSSDNLVVGSGGGLLQKDLNRDTSRWAIKPSFGVIKGKEYNFQKKVATDPTKASKTGKLKLTRTSKDGYMTLSSAQETAPMFSSYQDTLQTVYKDGQLFPTKFEDILKRTGG